MALHGHTKIELKDVKTGEKKIIEEDNMITNGLAKMLRPACGYANIFQTARGTEDGSGNMIDYLLGGILCFEKAQEENADNFFRNPQNRITAKGSIYEYMGEDITQGSYNKQESGVQPDQSFKKVWDFSTNQGNGTIESLSLTTSYFGENGDGCIVDGAQTMRKKEYSMAMPVYGIGAGYKYPADNSAPTIYTDKYKTSASGLAYADYTKNEIIFLDEASFMSKSGEYEGRYFKKNGKLLFTKLKFPFGKITPFTNPLNIAPGEEVEVAVPEEILNQCIDGQNACGIYSDTGFIYVLLCGNSIGPGQILNILKINAENFAAEVVKITNTSPVNITVVKANSMNGDGYIYGANNGRWGQGIDINNKYFTFQSFYGAEKNGKIYSIKMSNSAEIIEYKMDGNEFAPLMDFKPKTNETRKATSYNLSTRRMEDVLYIEGFDAVKGYQGYILNQKTGEAKKAKRGAGNYETVFFPVERYRYAYFLTEGEKEPVLYWALTYSPESGSQNERTAIMPMFRMDTLMTINNLSKPVIKTASQTMKITYTIREN